MNPNEICQRPGCGKKRSEHWSPNFCFEGSLKDTFLPLCKGTGNIDTDGESVDSLRTQLAEVTKEREALTLKNQSLMEDKERLDWWDSQRNPAFCISKFYVDNHKPLREQIDAARNKEAK